MTKKSIRFYNDREVRAVWDEDHSKWWFSAIDIVRAINDEVDYKKCRNYWKYLKGKMAKDGIEDCYIWKEVWTRETGHSWEEYTLLKRTPSKEEYDFADTWQFSPIKLNELSTAAITKMLKEAVA